MPPAHDDNAPVARLAAALNPAGPHTDRVVGAADAVALEVVREAARHRVSAMLSRELERGGRLAALAEPVRVALRQDVLASAMERARLDRLVLRVATVLSAAGVPLVLLKGAALGLTIYPEPALRQMTDVDVLVPEDAVDTALAALAAHGFRPPSREDQAFWRGAYYDMPVGTPVDLPGALEIHWSIAQPARHHPDLPGLFARARTIEWGGANLQVLGPADLFLHQALHLSYHYFEPKLAWILDLALLCRQGLPVTEIRQRARRWGMEVPLALAVLQVEKAFPGAADPELLHWAGESSRTRFVLSMFGTARPVDLLTGWNRRWQQLALAVLTLDRPWIGVLPVSSWLWRTVRFGDRAGHRRGAENEAAP